jgi:negative regulator of flagellin synthesis FlgM
MSMRIQAYSQIQQMYSPKKSARTSAASAVSKKDAVEFSSIGKDLQTAKKAVKEASDIRKDVTEPIKARIKNGTYDVSGESFADRLMEKFYAAV